MSEFFVEVVSYESDEVIRRIGPYASERAADKAENGVMANMNHDAYYTRVAEDGGPAK